MQIEADYYSREAPTLAPTGSGQVGVETRPGRAKVALLRPADPGRAYARIWMLDFNF